MSAIFLWDEVRREVASVSPHLSGSLAKADSRMERSLMRPEDVPSCAWVGYGIGKGVTSPEKDITIFGVPEHIYSGLHGVMVGGLSDVDPPPLCYEENHDKGFGSYIRWVFFADPDLKENYLGVDFSLSLRETSGVATSFKRVAEVVRALSKHGVPDITRVALLNWRMCEPEHLASVRKTLGLHTVAHWNSKAIDLFSKGSGFCPKCGLETFNDRRHLFCYRCGAPRST